MILIDLFDPMKKCGGTGWQCVCPHSNFVHFRIVKLSLLHELLLFFFLFFKQIKWDIKVEIWFGIIKKSSMIFISSKNVGEKLSSFINYWNQIKENINFRMIYIRNISYKLAFSKYQIHLDYSTITYGTCSFSLIPYVFLIWIVIQLNWNKFP